ncbi:WD repeat-containing protein 13 [Fopius arisanus]|uniref:WD repeat-containing protein 13 n=1 Tax=Fopius arisanus TaxID=64838 RepID=A0A0C9R409_9HYME|nr:PREDICTED: WD repeat-containing protein 13-like [Fopius arisanus]XP_011304263.1 PREDICTED: WD repeat-containing protein 13-like [Fopius arisanus]
MSGTTSKWILQWPQQVFALDAKYNTRRTSTQPAFGMLYIRRRSQLLRDKESKDPSLRPTYVKLRAELLRSRYGTISEYNGLGIPDDKSTHTRLNRKSTAESFAFAGVHHVFDQHIAGVTALKFANNDRSKLCCASFDGTISICNVTDSPPRVMAKLEGHQKGVTAIDWSISNDLIVSSGLDATVRLWGVHGDASPVCLRVVSDPFRSEVLCCAFVPANNNLVITGNGQGLLQILNVSTGIYPRGGTTKIGGKMLSLTCEESGGSLIWTGNDRGTITSLRMETASGRLSKLRRIDNLGGAVTSLSWRPWLSRESPWPTVLVSSACNAVSVYKIADSQGTLSVWKKYPIKHQQYLVRSTFCPRMGACLIASGSEDGSVHLLDTAREGKAAQVNRLHGHSAPILSIAFNYDETYLATGDHQGLVIIWQN